MPISRALPARPPRARDGLVVPALDIQRHVHQGDEYRHLHQGTDHGGEGHLRLDAEHGDRHSDGQLEIIAGGREGDTGRAGVVGAEPVGEQECHQEHEREVDGQRNRHQHHVQGRFDDGPALQREHYQDGEQQRTERDGGDAGQERLLIPRLAFRLHEYQP